jgi:spore germination protein YaaH
MNQFKKGYKMGKIIYIVQLGDSLYSISKTFNITVDELKQANLLTEDFVYPGQKLIIPSEFYIVQPGDSLYSISRKFNTTVQSIVALNKLDSYFLTLGQQLLIPVYTEVIVNVDMADIYSGPGTNYKIISQMKKNAKLPVLKENKNWYNVRLFDGSDGWIYGESVMLRVYDGKRPIVSILGFYTLEEGPQLPSSFESFVSNVQSISELGLFLYRLKQSNPLEIEKFGEFTDQYVKDLVTIAHRNNIKIIPVVHNLLYKNGSTKISKDLVSKMVSTKENRSIFINNVIQLIEKFNFGGVNIDIEDVYIEDSSKLSDFYTELGNELHKKGYYLSASVPSRVSDEPFNPFSDPFDYGAIGKAVDEFVVMLYNEHGWPGSGPGPVVSIGWMDRVLKYTLTKMLPQKVVAAVSVFGFDFNLTTGKNTYVTYEIAMDIAKKYNKQVIFDEKTQTPMFAYVDEQQNKHEVWFENTESIFAKCKKAWDLGIKGIALWRLGMEDSSMWNMFGKDVIVKK